MQKQSQLLVNKEFWDNYASIYDGKKASFDRYLRKRNLEILMQTFSPGQSLLEIGCGTGTEAMIMQSYGCKLTLVDLSYEMVKAASRKLNGEALFVNTPAENINCFKIQFDGAYASFGVVNCVTDPEGFFGKLHRILKPNGYFVASVINRWYWGDFLLSAIRIPNYLKKRLKGKGNIILNGVESSATAHFYSPRTLAKLASPQFKIRKYYALPVALPPPYLNPAQKLPRRLFTLLDGIESVVYNKFPFKLFGDQTIIVFQKNNIV